MVKQKVLFGIFGLIIWCGANSGCSGDDAASGRASETENSPKAIVETPKEAAATRQSATLAGGAPVAAKRENLTLADRENFLRAVGMPEQAETSASFLEYLKNMYAPGGLKVENSAMKFFRLGGEKYLVEIMIDQGAYAGGYVYALYQEIAPNQATAKALEFDSYRKEDGATIKTTEKEIGGYPKFDDDAKILIVNSPGRGIGGCGTYAKYKFAADRAETIEARYRECRDDNDDTPPERWEKIALGEINSTGKTANEAGEFQHLKSAHATVLKNWLAAKPGLRPAVTADYDRANPKLVAIRKEYETGHPYYVAGDFSGDGKEDFAVILKSGKTDKSFNLAVFNYPFNGAGAQPALFGDSDYRFVLHFEQNAEEKNQSLYVGSYASDDGFLLIPEGKSYKAVSPINEDL